MRESTFVKLVSKEENSKIKKKDSKKITHFIYILFYIE